MKKLFQKIRLFFFGLAYGMRKTEEEVLTQVGGTIGETGMHREIHENRVSKALLRGEVTQEVIDLRYRTYEVDKKSKNYEFFSPLLAIDNGTKDSKKVRYEKSDERELVLIQPNRVLTENIGESLERLDSKDKVKEKYLIKVERSITPRFRIEDFTTRLVVKRGDNDTTAILDFYVPKYKSSTDFRLNTFLTDVKRIKDEWFRSDTLEFDSVHFITSHAYGVNDMFSFLFTEPIYLETVEFDGHYVLRFVARVVDGGTDLTAEYYSERMARKYENKEAKRGGIKFSPNVEGMENIDDRDEASLSMKREYVCSVCGKVMKYDAKAMDELNPTISNDDFTETTEGATEYIDAEICEATFGKAMCKNCLAKYLESENNMQKTNR